ncbi:MAG: hypothetical protein JJU10_02930 [Idiomarina sp.]|nr:hypothetical protein [Idiomarina sp.]
MRAILGVLLLALASCAKPYDDVTSTTFASGGVGAASFAPEGHFAASASNTIGIYTENAELSELVHLPDPNGLWRVLWQNGETLWAYDRNNLLRIERATGTITHDYPFVEAPIRTLALHHTTLVVASEAGWVDRFTISSSGELVNRYRLAEEVQGLSAVAVNTNDARTTTGFGTRDGVMRFWYNDTEQTPVELDQPILDAAFTYNELWLITSRFNNPIATRNQLTLWHATRDRLSAHALPEDIGFNHLQTLERGLLVGGGNHQWAWFNPDSHEFAVRQYGAQRNPNQRGVILHAAASGNEILLLSSRGELQRWEKTSIFGNNL